MGVYPGTRSRPPVPLILSFTLAGAMVNTLIAPTLPDIVDALAVAPSRAGLLLTAASLPGIALAPVIGVLADRFGRRAVLVPSLVLFALAGASGALASGFWMLVGFRLLQGVGAVALLSLAIVLIGDHWDGVERARIMGRNGAVVTVSLAILPLVGGFLTEVAGWRAPFVVYLFALVPAWYAFRRLPSVQRSSTSLREQFAAALPYFKSGTVLGVLAAGVLFFLLAFGLILTVLPLYAREAFGLSAGSRGVLVALPALTSIPAALFLGRAVERVGVRTVVVGATALLAIAYAVIGATSTLAVVVVGVLLYGLAGGLVFPSLQNVIAGAAPASSRGTLVAVWTAAVRVGQTIGPTAGSTAMPVVGVANTFTLGAVLALALPLLLVRCVRPARSQPQPES